MVSQFLKKHGNYRKSLTVLGLALFLTSCAASEIPETSSTDTFPAEESVATEVSETNAATNETQTPQTSEIESKQSSAMDAETLLKSFEQGTTYATVRDRLIEAGWVPVEAAEPGEFGVEREAYDAGFTEVTACAGTGAGQCQFNFENPSEKKVLSITTYGGSDLQFGDWSINSPVAQAATSTDDSITLTGSSAIIQEARSEIPTQFQGEWNMNLDGCGSPLSDGRLIIEPKKLQFYESTGTVSEVMVTGTAGLTVTSEYFAEGDTFTETDSFELSGDSSTLTHLETDAVRYRCSG